MKEAGVLVRWLVLCLTGAVALLIAISCGGRESLPDESRREPPGTGPAGGAEPAPALPARPEGTPRIVILGDSLTAGLGLPVSQSFPSLLQERLDREGYEYEVVNAGVSGDTSAGGLRRLPWALDGDVRVLVVALGGNDGLRGLPVAELKRNLTAIVRQGTERGLIVIVAGMEAPPNNGPEYTASFRQVYSDLAGGHSVRLIPFLLQGVAGEEALNQTDGIHPNARGASVVADTVWDALQPALTRPTHTSR